MSSTANKRKLLAEFLSGKRRVLDLFPEYMEPDYEKMTTAQLKYLIAIGERIPEKKFNLGNARLTAEDIAFLKSLPQIKHSIHLK